MATYELKYTAEEIDGILESVDEKTIYGDATQSEHGLMSTTDKSKLDSLPSSQQINTSLSGKVDKMNGKGLSTNDYDATAKAKVDAIPSNPKYTDTTYEAGDGISIENNVISVTGGGDSVTVDNELSSSSENPVQNKVIKAALDGKANTSQIPDVRGKYDTADTAETTIDDSDYMPFYDISATAKRKTLWSNIKAKLKAYFDTIYLTSHQDISGKADKATTLAGYGITDAKIENGVITLGSNTITPLTSHQSLSGYATEAWVGQQGYLTQHQDISGKQDKSNLVTSLSDLSTDAQYPSAKCVYDLIGDIETLLNAI